jgi:hypothetical protein
VPSRSSDLSRDLATRLCLSLLMRVVQDSSFSYFHLFHPRRQHCASQSFFDPTHLLPSVFGTATWHPVRIAPWLPKRSGLWRLDAVSHHIGAQAPISNTPRREVTCPEFFEIQNLISDSRQSSLHTQIIRKPPIVCLHYISFLFIIVSYLISG